MPRIRLRVEQDPNSVVVTVRMPDDTTAGVSNLRLRCLVYAGRDPKGHSAIVDTGAPTSVFPHSVWQRFQADIRWLPFADGSITKPATLGGKSYQYRLGLVPVRILGGDEGPEFTSPGVVAQFEQLDPMRNPSDRLTRTLVGLQFGPLENRHLVVSPTQTHSDRCEAWITDERPVDPLALTSATL